MISVMLVDDHDLVRAGIKRMLHSNSGLRVISEARSGEEAIQICRTTTPDVILMDIKMPGIGGFEATRKLLRQNPSLRILIVTVCGNDLYPSRLLQIGASGYLTKGASMDEMVQAIQSVHEGQRYISADIASRLALRHVADAEHLIFELLSERELQIVLMITMGLSVNQISEKLCLCAKTINSYRYRIYEKLGVKNDVELTLLAIRHELIESEETDVL